MCYHKFMASKRYSKRSSKRTVIKLSPKEAEDIIKSEFTTEKGNKMQKRFIFKPHLPKDATIQFKIKGDRKETDNGNSND